MHNTAFSSLHLKTPMLKNLVSLGYTGMTPVQAHALPAILAGKDVIAKAKTGSGKNVAFGIGLLTQLDASLLKVQALVLCPTRELASLAVTSGKPSAPAMITLCIDGGRKNKLRPGDILGALTGAGGIAGSEVGKIDVADFHSYVAIVRQSVAGAMVCLAANRIKGRFFKVRKIS